MLHSLRAKKGSGIERIDTLEIICGALGIELWELLKPYENDTMDNPCVLGLISVRHKSFCGRIKLQKKGNPRELCQEIRFKRH